MAYTNVYVKLIHAFPNLSNLIQRPPCIHTTALICTMCSRHFPTSRRLKRHSRVHRFIRTPWSLPVDRSQAAHTSLNDLCPVAGTVPNHDDQHDMLGNGPHILHTIITYKMERPRQMCTQDGDHRTMRKPLSICTSTAHSHHHTSPACGPPLCNSSPRRQCASRPYGKPSTERVIYNATWLHFRP